MKLRSLVFWPHLIAGTVAGAVILVMSLTGALLTYERQLVAWSNAGLQSQPPSPRAERRPVEDLLRSFSAWRGSSPSAVSIGAGATDPVIVTAGAQTYYLDAYSGRVLGEGRQGVRQFMTQVRAWHRWLAADGDSRTTARAVTGWSNLAFLFIVTSGLYLWLPRRWSWQHIRPVLAFAPRARGKARDFNWHNVIGVWCLVPLFIVVACAVPMSFPWANDLVYRAAGEAPPSGRGGPGEGPRAESRDGRTRGTGVDIDGVNALMLRATQQEPYWRTVTLRLPESPRAPLAFAIDRGDGGQPQRRSTLTLDRAGAVVGYDTFAGQSAGRRLRSLMRFAHTGEVLGLPGQTIAGVASAGAVVLVWTGIALALRRGRGWLVRRRARRAPPIGAAAWPEPALPSLSRAEETRS